MKIGFVYKNIEYPIIVEKEFGYEKIMSIIPKVDSDQYDLVVYDSGGKIEFIDEIFYEEIEIIIKK